MVTGIGTISQGVGNMLNNVHQSPEPMKKPSDNRRSNKPIMEKRRRARINNCLNELKTLILDATKKDPARHSKLEKADILEKTVKHLQELQRQQKAMSQAADPTIVNKFKAGFSECAKEVAHFHGLDPVVKSRLLQHLSNYLNGVKNHQHEYQAQPVQQVQIHMLPSSPPSSPDQDQQQHQPQQQQQKPQHLQQQQILQITPTNGYYLKLPNGVFTYVSPQQLTQATNNVQLPTLVPIPSRTSSTASAASNTSTSYDRLSRDTTNSPTSYAPPSPANSYEAMDYQPTATPTIMTSSTTTATVRLQQSISPVSMMMDDEQMSRSYSPVPLSLVMRKSEPQEEEERPWRPW